jgi:excisionase family DNA binding protein
MNQANKYSVRQAAIRMRCTLKNVYDLLYAGRFAGAVKVGKTWRIPKRAVEGRRRAPGAGGRRGK